MGLKDAHVALSDRLPYLLTLTLNHRVVDIYGKVRRL